MQKIREWFKRVFSLTNLALCLGFLVGVGVNICGVLGIYGLGLLMSANVTQSILVGSVFAYPLAKLANKYANIGFKKLFKV